MIQQIRNFCIISHIDHGKSTLADRFLEVTKTVEARQMKEQILDNMDLERERGITIKLQPVRMIWMTPTNVPSQRESAFILNLIDTPGHADFSYEVSRSLNAVEGALLLVDATQGVQAQTLANLDLAQKAGLVIIPIVNKIDLPEARPEEVAFEIAEIINCDPDEVVFISAKTGEGIEDLLKLIVKKIPGPRDSMVSYPRALVFDSSYDDYRGVVVYVRMFDGEIKKGDEILFFQQNVKTTVSDIGYIQLGLKSADSLKAGETGFIVTTLKEVAKARVGDTVTTLNQKLKVKNQNDNVKIKIENSSREEIQTDIQPLPGYKEPKPMVFAEFYTSSGEDYVELRESLSKLKLSDSSIVYEPVSSKAFGFGFKCGFLGLLHLEIIKERLEREYDLELVITTPTVEYKRTKQGGYLEPWVEAEIITPQKYLGRLIELLQQRRGVQKNIRHLEEKVILVYEIPLGEIIVDFYDQIKSITSGYGSLNYEFIEFREGDLVQIDFLVAEEKFEAFSRVVYSGFAERIARAAVVGMKELIPRQNFEVKIQAALGGRILASERITPFRKDVTEKLYGGDVTRKRKLLEKQKKGKRRLAQIGKVSVPTDVFIKLLKY